MKKVVIPLVIIGFASNANARDIKESDNLPEWIAEDCIEKDQKYYIVGSATGIEKSDAMNKVSENAKRAALKCVFSINIKSETKIKEKMHATSVDGKESVTEENEVSIETISSIDTKTVSWIGFKLVEGRTLFTKESSKYRAYAQYSWSVISVNTMLQKLKSQIIDNQRAVLKSLDVEQKKLEEQTNAAVNAVRELRKKQNEPFNHLLAVMSEVYCGMTLGELKTILGEPTSWIYKSDLIDYWTGAQWGEFVVYTETPVRKANVFSTSVSEVGEPKDLLKYRIKGITKSFGHIWYKTNICG